MKKLVITLFAVVVSSSMFLGLVVGTAQSRPQYYGEFKKMYVKPDGSDADKAFAKEVTEAKCFVCHEPGNDRKLRNQYGKELAKVILPADWDMSKKYPGERDKAKIEEALKKVADIHVDPNDPKSPTYGDLIKQRKIARRRRKVAARWKGEK